MSQLPLEIRMDELERRVGNLEASHDLLIRLDARVEAMREDVSELKSAQGDMTRSLDKDRDRYAEQRKEDEQQAKSDRHWLIGTIVASSSFIVAAVALIVGNL